MICKKCGSEIQEGEQFCGKCGAKIKKGIMAKYLIIGIAIILIGFLIIGIGDELEKVKVPDVVGLTTEEARKEIPNVPLTFIDPLSLSVSCHIGSGAIAIVCCRILK